MLIFWEIAVIIKQCFQNIRRKFHEFLFQKYFKEMKMLLWSQKVRSLSSKIFNINSLLSWNVFLNFIETDFHWEQEARVLFWKGSYRCLTAGKNLELAQNYYQYITFLYYIIILQIFSIRYLSISVFRTAKNLCYCMFFWHHATWQHVTNFFNCSYQGTRHYKRESSNLPTIEYLPVQSQQIKTLAQVVKYVQT